MYFMRASVPSVCKWSLGSHWSCGAVRWHKWNSVYISFHFGRTICAGDETIEHALIAANIRRHEYWTESGKRFSINRNRYFDGENVMPFCLVFWCKNADNATIVVSTWSISVHFLCVNRECISQINSYHVGTSECTQKYLFIYLYFTTFKMLVPLFECGAGYLYTWTSKQAKISLSRFTTTAPRQFSSFTAITVTCTVSPKVDQISLRSISSSPRSIHVDFLLLPQWNSIRDTIYYHTTTRYRMEFAARARARNLKKKIAHTPHMRFE